MFILWVGFPGMKNVHPVSPTTFGANVSHSFDKHIVTIVTTTVSQKLSGAAEECGYTSLSRDTRSPPSDDISAHVYQDLSEMKV